MAKTSNVPIIIKKVKKGGHGGHHGGAWKVAYADFVTAIMAFFLLLWLLNVTTDIQKRGIADYFEPTISSKSASGAGGVMGGLTIGQPGSQQVSSTVPGLAINRPALRRPNEGEEGELGGTAGKDAKSDDGAQGQIDSAKDKENDKDKEKEADKRLSDADREE